MKKTLLFLMGVSLAFFSQSACVDETHQSEEDSFAIYKFMIAATVTSSLKSTVKSCLKNMKEKSSRLEISPTTVVRMICDENIIIAPKPIQRQISFEENNSYAVGNNDSELEDSMQMLSTGFKLCRPDSLGDQSNLELSALATHNGSNGMLRVHSSQYSILNLYDHVTPDLGKTPESDADMRLRSNSEDSGRARSESSEYFLGSCSFDSPHKSSHRQRAGMAIHQLNKTPDLGKTPSPRK